MRLYFGEISVEEWLKEMRWYFAVNDMRNYDDKMYISAFLRGKLQEKMESNGNIVGMGKIPHGEKDPMMFRRMPLVVKEGLKGMEVEFVRRGS